jgi:hypothetical protein
MNKPRPGAWIICQNPDCNNTDNPDHAFLVPYRKRHRIFCSVQCAAIVSSNTPERKKAAGEKLRQANQVRHILYPDWVKNNKNAVSKMLIERNKTQEMRDLSGRRLSIANSNRKELYPLWYENNKNAVSKMFQNPEFLTAHKARWSKVLKEIHSDPDFIARRDKRASETFLQLNQDPEFVARRDKRSSETLLRLWQDPEFAARAIERARIHGSENITRYNQSEQGRNTSSKTAHQTISRLNQDPDFIARRDKRASETFFRLWQDPEFREKSAKTSRDNLKRLRQDPEFIAKQSKAASDNLKRLHLDPEFRKRWYEVSRETMIRQVQNGDFGRAQKLLFDRLPELNPLLSEYLLMEKIVYLTDDIRDRYYGSNKSHYRIDIAYVTGDQIKLAVEVDGSMGHSTDEELQRDRVRDNILLSEFGIPTIRVKNEEIFRDVDIVAKSIIDEVSLLSTQ